MFKQTAKAGDLLDHRTALLDMICTDLDGDHVVIDKLHDHKHAEVGIWANGHYQFDGTRVRYDELTWTGEMYEGPEAVNLPTP